MTATERMNLESYRAERARRTNVDDELCKVLTMVAWVVLIAVCLIQGWVR